MPDDNITHQKQKQSRKLPVPSSSSTQSFSPASSFIYPVRSLLAGIQPAGESKTQESIGRRCSPESTASVTSRNNDEHFVGVQDGGQSSVAVASVGKGIDQKMDGDHGSTEVDQKTDMISRTLQKPSGPMSPAEEQRDRKTMKTASTTAGVTRDCSPPSRTTRDSKFSQSNHLTHFSIGENPYFPRTFTQAQPTTDSPNQRDTADVYTAGPMGEPVIYPPHDRRNADADSTDLSQFADAFKVKVTVEKEVSKPEDGVVLPALPFNPSEYGLVHLPPLPASPSVSGSSGPQSRSRSIPSSAGRASGSSQTSADPIVQSQNLSSLARRLETLEEVSPPLTESQSSGSPPPPRFHRSTMESGVSRAASQSSTNSNSELSEMGPLVSFTYEDAQDEDGHHVVVGREGQLTRCEDEPVRTPGAIQNFGVLIAVNEDIENGTLVVRQVSENSGDILGLSPEFLFSLECFTDTLLESHANVLWDNMEFLNEPEADPEEQEDSPHIFLLTGWGEPGSASPNDLEADGGRRSWTCWCAVHRPQIANSDGLGSSPVGGSGLIIMEFELERDMLNPLYPPLSFEDSLGISFPATTAAGTHSTASTPSTEDSDGTLVTTDSESGILGGNLDGVPTPVDHPPPTDELHQQQLPLPWSPNTPSSLSGLEGEDSWHPSAEDILESTTSHSKPLLALERLRRLTRGVSAPNSQLTSSTLGNRRGRRHRRTAGGSGSVGMMDVFAVMAQINEQFGAAPDLETFLKVVVGVIKDLTQFHRVMAYQFDEAWNGQVVAELVDWNQTHDLYKGLHFPASDIPVQARELYAINKVRLLYDRSQTTARIVVRSQEDLETPLNMTHCYLRAMSPIHVKYLENMGVRASMSISIMAFGALWGLIMCHSYGSHGMRVSFPVRQMLRLLSQSISRNIERLSYAQRLHTRKLINTMASDNHSTGYIVSNADDLLGLFDADYGILVIGEGAKILGPNQHGQEILVMAEYLRLKQFNAIQVSQAVVKDFPDLHLSTGLEVIAGLLYVPLSSGGKDFIALLRKGQPRDVHWAGKPYKDGSEAQSLLEPRKSFKIWSEIVAGRCRVWTDEQLETAGVLALVYGKFIEVWRQKENALHATKLTELLLSNASHEVRTPLNHIINYLEMALNGPLDFETRDNLSRSHAASKSLLFTINDLLDLTRLESGNETSFNEPFDLQSAIEDATRLYKNEAGRRNIVLKLDIAESPKTVFGDSRKIRSVVSNLTANALKYTSKGEITVQCHTFEEPEGLRRPRQTAVEIVVADTGCGIASEKLESIFREFEQVESSGPKTGNSTGVGLGLAVVARIVEQLGGQLRVDSKVDEGSRFSFLIPLSLTGSEFSLSPSSSRASSLRQSRANSSTRSHQSRGSEIDSLLEVLGSSHMSDKPRQIEGSPSLGSRVVGRSPRAPNMSPPCVPGTFEVTGSSHPIRPIKMDESTQISSISLRTPTRTSASPPLFIQDRIAAETPKLRVLIVEDNDINRIILAKRLTLDGHTVINTTNGQEGLDMVISDGEFDCVLMDIQMPILNGFEATERIRALEGKPPASPNPSAPSRRPPVKRRLSHALNGRIPIFAVSASLFERQREELVFYGLDGWILKPIDFKRLAAILRGVTDSAQRERDIYHPGYSWEAGGWLSKPDMHTKGSSMS